MYLKDSMARHSGCVLLRSFDLRPAVCLGSRHVFQLFFVSRGVFLKGMDDRFLLSKDEHLTLNIDKVMVMYDSWRRGERPRSKDRGPKYVRFHVKVAI